MLGDPKFDSKPSSFRWTPIFINNSVITIINSSPKKNYSQHATSILTFYRKADSSTISKEIKLKPFGEFRLKLDNELKTFLKEDGWVTIKSDNPYVMGYYFVFHPSGAVAGDHFF